MTVMTQEPSAGTPVRESIASRLLVPGFWGAVSIVTMWLAVLFVGVFGGDMTFDNSSSQVTVMPSAVAVALFAAIATAAVAKRAFANKDLAERTVVPRVLITEQAHERCSDSDSAG